MNSLIELTEKIINQNGGREAFIDENGNPDIMKMFSMLTSNKEYCDSAIPIANRMNGIPKEIIGVRKAGTEEGTWTGAYVIARFEIFTTAALFQDGMDFINNDLTWAEALKSRDELVEQGWVTMTNSDIEKTSGICPDSVAIANNTQARFDEMNKSGLGLVRYTPNDDSDNKLPDESRSLKRQKPDS